MKFKYIFLKLNFPKHSFHVYVQRTWVFLLIIFFFINCKKLVEVDSPNTSITGTSVFDSDETSTAVLTAMYAKLSSTSNYNTKGFTTISLFSGLSSDELTLYDGVTSISYNAYYTNMLSIDNGGFDYWNIIYPYIFTCNSAIKGLNESESLNSLVKQQLMGEAKFMRAFFYFYLVNFYGDVPLALSEDYKINSVLTRAPKAQVYQQIISDLKDAQTLLANKYVSSDVKSSTTERVRPNKWAATALLARVYLYTGEWANAEDQTTAVINNTALYILNTLDNAFLKNNTEAIWQLQPVNIGWNTEDARIFILDEAQADNKPVYLSRSLLNAFEINDNRRTNWVKDTIIGTVTYSYPYKYKSAKQDDPVIEYLMMLRLGEQYLIRAEARAQQNNISGAQSDLNKIRVRAGLPNTSSSDKSSLLAALLHERQVELFTEFGNRWLDIKRTNVIDVIMNISSPLKGGSWEQYKQWYPIPLTEILRNPNLVQNVGY